MLCRFHVKFLQLHVPRRRLRPAPASQFQGRHPRGTVEAATSERSRAQRVEDRGARDGVGGGVGSMHGIVFLLVNELR